MTNFNFKNLSAHEVDAEIISSFTIEGCELDDAKGHAHAPTLYGRTAGEKNKPLLTAARVANAKRGGKARKRTDEKIIQLARENTRELFPKFVLTGWDDVYDGAGKAVKFSEDACTAFMAALPDHLLNGVMEHFANSSNFTQAAHTALTDEEIEEAAGN